MAATNPKATQNMDAKVGVSSIKLTIPIKAIEKNER